MTETRIAEIINEVYGYAIIDDFAESELKSNRNVILSELGIESIYEFLSYDITEFQEARKSIHVRRFYQMFRKIFRFESFTIESFHMIQAGCLYSALTSGIMRGYGAYEYTGFVSEVLAKVRNVSGTGKASLSLAGMIDEISRQFELFSRVSLGIYSLQIFTKYGICFEKLKLAQLEQSKKLFAEVLRKIEQGQEALPEIRKLLKLKLPDDKKIDEVTDEYIEYAVKGVMEEGIPISRSRLNKKLTESVSDARKEGKKAFAGLYIDVESARYYQRNLQERLNIYERNEGADDVSILYVSMLDKLIHDFQKLRYYEDIFYIKRLNSLFIEHVKDVFDAQMNEEISNIREQCVRIIEENIDGFNVYELDGALNAISMHKEEFDEQFSIEADESSNAENELRKYLRQQLEMTYEIRKNLRENLSGILNPDILQNEQSGILDNAIRNFTDIKGFLLEEE
jgi:hypothetical protein